MKLLKDNSIVCSNLTDHPIVKQLLNKDISTLRSENFIVFPTQTLESKDLEDDNYIFQLSNGKIWTRNIVGLLSYNNDVIQIQSRFMEKSNEDFFLRYMMQKVLNFNVVSSSLNSDNMQSHYDLLMYVFPYLLNEAMKKGVYKEYVENSYNDANIKGRIDVASQIKYNSPFTGKVAYRTREFSYDNKITQLIRHTIEKIQKEKSHILTQNDVTRENIRTIKEMTHSFSYQSREAVVRNNLLNPIKHGYYEEYSSLQRLCLQILKDNKTGYGNDEMQVQGVIIDVAWLWEEYIHKITNWNHYGRKSHLGTLKLFKQLFEETQQHRYPDFEVNGVPIDTKYKRRLDKRNDYNQITTYVHILESSQGGFLQPTDEYDSKSFVRLGTLYGGGDIFTYKFYIPQEKENYESFVEEIILSEKTLLETFCIR